MAHNASSGVKEVMDQAGNPLRVGQGGVAFAVGLDGSPAKSEITLDTSVSRVQDSGEPALTAEQISEKLAAAEARRQAALDEVRFKGAEEASKVEKASETRQQYQEEVKEALDAKLDNATANQEAQRLALLERLRLEEIHHEQVLSNRANSFQNKIREMDSKYTEQEGNRHEVLAEIVDKVKEHNDRVKAIHDELMADRRHDSADGGVGNAAALKKQQYLDATSQREEYLNAAEARLASNDVRQSIAKYNI